MAKAARLTHKNITSRHVSQNHELELGWRVTNKLRSRTKPSGKKWANLLKKDLSPFAPETKNVLVASKRDECYLWRTSLQRLFHRW